MIKTKKYLKKIFGFKKDLDNLAEVSWKEEKTKNYIIRKLGRNFCWSKKTALIYKLGKGPAVFFRAELDALNTVNGPKHVCGHSAHLAALMGAYLYFSAQGGSASGRKDNLLKHHTLYFVFQPSEENYPSGAKFITKNFAPLKKCKIGFAFHVCPEFHPGEIINPVFGSGDYFEIKINSSGGHVKDKNNLIKRDVILAAGRLIEEINSRKFDDYIANIGTIKGGEAANKIAGGAILTGDIRALTFLSRKNAYRWLREVCVKNQLKNQLVKINLQYWRGYPILKNNQKIFKKIKPILNIRKSVKSFGTEDFSLYPAPKIFLLIGTGGKEKLHSDNFKVSDKIVKSIFYNWIKIGENLDKISRF